MKPEQRAKAMSLLIEGESQHKVSEKIGVSQPTISRLANEETVKEMIESAQLRLYSENLEKIVDNMGNLISQAHKILSDEDSTPQKVHDAKTLLELANRVQQRILQGAGIFPSSSQSILIQNIQNQTNIPGVLSPTGLEYLRWLKNRERKNIADVGPEAIVE